MAVVGESVCCVLVFHAEKLDAVDFLAIAERQGHSPTVTGLRCRFTRAISSAALYWRMGFIATRTSLQALVPTQYFPRGTGVPHVRNGVGVFLAMLFALREWNHGVPPALFRPGGPASKCRWREPTVGIGGSFFFRAPGPRGPGRDYAAPPGLDSRVNMRCIAAMEFVRILSQARRANASIF